MVALVNDLIACISIYARQYIVDRLVTIVPSIYYNEHTALQRAQRITSGLTLNWSLIRGHAYRYAKELEPYKSTCSIFTDFYGSIDYNYDTKQLIACRHQSELIVCHVISFALCTYQGVVLVHNRDGTIGQYTTNLKPTESIPLRLRPIGNNYIIKIGGMPAYKESAYRILDSGGNYITGDFFWDYSMAIDIGPHDNAYLAPWL